MATSAQPAAFSDSHTEEENKGTASQAVVEGASILYLSPSQVTNLLRRQFPQQSTLRVSKTMLVLFLATHASL